MESTEAKIARLEATVAAVQTDVADIKADQKSQLGKLDQLLAVEHERRGAKKLGATLMKVGSGSGFAAAAAWLWEHLTK